MTQQEEEKKENEVLDLKELEKVEGGSCTVACDSGCLWSGKEVRADK